MMQLYNCVRAMRSFEQNSIQDTNPANEFELYWKCPTELIGSLENYHRGVHIYGGEKHEGWLLLIQGCKYYGVETHHNGIG